MQVYVIRSEYQISLDFIINIIINFNIIKSHWLLTLYKQYNIVLCNKFNKFSIEFS
jgi:hypothetical protein